MITEENLRRLYLDTLEKSLIGLLLEDPPDPHIPPAGFANAAPAFTRRIREQGRDFPSKAYTMIGADRMANIRRSVELALADGVPGDFLEAGVWRGGATIFMRGMLKAYHIRDRKVWVVNSFEGMPEPEIRRFPADAPWMPWAGRLSVSLETVKHNFDNYCLLDDQVWFLKGWFKDTLPTASIEKLAVLRLDGDLYQSIQNSLTHLYPKLSVGGFVIVDDFYFFKETRQAVLDYRAAHAIIEPILEVGGNAAYWRREA